jgi:hypothetical protein
MLIHLHQLGVAPRPAMPAAASTGHVFPLMVVLLAVNQESGQMPSKSSRLAELLAKDNLMDFVLKTNSFFVWF